MILLDDRTGSKELLPHFKPFDVEAEVCRLGFADAAFCGNCEEGQIEIGIERKVLGDLVSSIRTERLSGHQLDGLLEYYAVNYLIVEGIYRPGKCGELEQARNGGWQVVYVGRTPMLYKEVDNFLTTMEAVGMRIRRTAGITETATVIVDLYKWWQKDWDKHKGHMGIYAPVPEKENKNGNHKVSLLRRPKANLVTCMAAQIPGLNQKAWEVGKWFKSPMEMVMADEKEWQKIDGIGKKGSKQIVNSLQGG